MTNPAAAPTSDRRISAPIQSERPHYDATIELHREIQRLKDEKQAMAETIEQLSDQIIQPAVIDTAITVMPRMSIAEALERDQFIRDAIDNLLIPGIDFGPLFPNAKVNALKKSGAEKFATLFGLFADPIEVEKVVERAPDSILTQHVRYEYRCDLHIGSRLGPVVGSAIGICSSEEDKYKYRQGERTCPDCGTTYIRRSNRADKDGDKGWYCWNNPGRDQYGCGAQFHSEDPRIISQNVDRVINPDMMGLQHTIAAMAQKRAFVLAVRAATGLSAYFAEIVIDEDDTRARSTVDSTATHKSSASIAAELIKYAESLLPEGHGYSRNDIGRACLKALGMADWSDDYDGTMDDAKSAIATALNKKNGNTGEIPTQDAKTTPKSSDSNKSELCAKCEKNPRLNDDGPYPFLCAECAREEVDQQAAKEATQTSS